MIDKNRNGQNSIFKFLAIIYHKNCIFEILGMSHNVLLGVPSVIIWRFSIGFIKKKKKKNYATIVLTCNMTGCAGRAEHSYLPEHMMSFAVFCVSSYC